VIFGVCVPPQSWLHLHFTAESAAKSLTGNPDLHKRSFHGSSRFSGKFRESKEKRITRKGGDRYGIRSGEEGRGGREKEFRLLTIGGVWSGGLGG